MSVNLIILATLGLLLGWVWFFYMSQRLAISKITLPPTPDHFPSMTVIRPIKDVDSGLRENVSAGFEDVYPAPVQTLFVFDDDLDPAVSIVKAVIQERLEAGLPAEAEILFSGQPPRNRTGKLNAMIKAMEKANHSLIAFVDSDIRQSPGDLERLAATLLSDKRAGASFPTVVSNAPLHTLGDTGYAVMVNGLYEPSALATAQRNGGTLPFIMGHMMVLRREAIVAIGGLETAEGQLVDDMFLGRRMVEEGYRNLLAPKPVSIIQQDCTFVDFVGILIRWIAFSITGLPFWTTKLPHALTGLALWSGILALGYGAVIGNPGILLLGLLTALSVPLTINSLHYRMSGQPIPWQYSWSSMIIWLAAPLIYLQIWIRREVNWRGRRYRLTLNSRLG